MAAFRSCRKPSPHPISSYFISPASSPRTTITSSVSSASLRPSISSFQQTTPFECESHQHTSLQYSLAQQTLPDPPTPLRSAAPKTDPDLKSHIPRISTAEKQLHWSFYVSPRQIRTIR